MAEEKHEHNYIAAELVPINKIENKHYIGFAGDKAFLMRTCKCGAKQAFDYGPTETMKERLAPNNQ